MNEELSLTVTGVLVESPKRTHLDFDFLISLAGVEFWPGEQTYWGANMYDVYALTRPGVDIEQLNKKNSEAIDTLDHENALDAENLEKTYEEKLSFEQEKYFQLEQEIIQANLLHQQEL